MSYVGETPIKKIARLKYWQEVRRLCGNAFYSQCHVFLASEHAGDASVLSGMGVPWENMIAIDMDPKACSIASRKWPLLRVENAAVDKFALRWQGMHPASVYLDFCAQLSKATSQTFANVIRTWCATKVVGATLLKGREQGLFGRHIRKLNKPSSYTAETSAELRQARGRVFELTAYAVADASIEGRQMFSFPVCHKTFTYRTVSPMLIGVFELRRCVGRVHSHLLGHSCGVIPKVETECVTQVTASDIRDYVLCSAFGERTAELLNVDARQAAAWRAHSSRGTYNRACQA